MLSGITRRKIAVPMSAVQDEELGVLVPSSTTQPNTPSTIQVSSTTNIQTSTTTDRSINNNHHHHHHHHHNNNQPSSSLATLILGTEASPSPTSSPVRNHPHNYHHHHHHNSTIKSSKLSDDKSPPSILPSRNINNNLSPIPDNHHHHHNIDSSDINNESDIEDDENDLLTSSPSTTTATTTPSNHSSPNRISTTTNTTTTTANANSTLSSYYHSIDTFLRESLVLPLMLMYFAMLMINTLLRDTKDTMLVNSVAGVSAIPILKTWITIPSSVIFFTLYSRLAHSQLSSRTQFVVVCISFAIFYVCFAIILYPFKKVISPTNWALSVRSSTHAHSVAATLASVAEEWTLGAFYVVSELWSSAVCQLLFWQVANDVMTIRSAKDVYPLIGATGNAGLIVAGRLLLIFADRRDIDSARAYLRIVEAHHGGSGGSSSSSSGAGGKGHIIKNSTTTTTRVVSEFDAQVEVSFHRFVDEMDPNEAGWLGTLLGIAVLVITGVAFIIVCYDDVYRRMREFHPQVTQRKYLHDMESSTKRNNNNNNNNNNEHQSALQAFWFVYKSDPLRLIAILVSSYGVSSSIIEVCWKGQVKRAFPDVGDYSRFMGSFWMWTGVSSMGFMVLSRNILRRLGYRVAVVFTPLTMMLAGGVFFSVAIAVAFHIDFKSQGVSISAVAALAGAFAVLVAKSAKYAVFDSTKEMIFIPLDKESQKVGKAAIDVVAYRLSKSGGSFFLQFILFMFGSLEDVGLIPIGIVFIIIVLLWLRAALATGKLVHEAQRLENEELERVLVRP
jgi:ATP/ADP translocase